MIDPWLPRTTLAGHDLAPGGIGALQDAAIGVPCARVAAGSSRMAWPDVARGYGIVLVVIGHSIGGMLAGGQVQERDTLGGLFFLMYTFHMPLFFILSGMFMPDRLGRPLGDLARSSAVRIVYPYFVWGLVQIAVIAILGHLVNAPIRPSVLLFLQVLWEPPSQFWFLYCLVLYQAAAVLFGRYAGLTAMLAAALAARLACEAVELPKIVDLFARYWIFYAGAIRFADCLRDDRVVRSGSQWLFGLAAAWLAAAVVSAWGGGYGSLWNLPAALLGSLLVMGLAHRPDPLRGALAELGRCSMPIFVTHVLIVAGVRIGLTKILGVSDPLVILPVATAAGLLIPYGAYRWLDRRGLAGLAALK